MDTIQYSYIVSDKITLTYKQRWAVSPIYYRRYIIADTLLSNITIYYRNY